jgi:hypothetical protein
MKNKGTRIMKLTILGAIAVAAITGGPSALAAADVVIGDIDDLTGVYSDNGGVGGIEAIKVIEGDRGIASGPPCRLTLPLLFQLRTNHALAILRCSSASGPFSARDRLSNIMVAEVLVENAGQ